MGNGFIGYAVFLNGDRQVLTTFSRLAVQLEASLRDAEWIAHLTSIPRRRVTTAGETAQLAATIGALTTNRSVLKRERSVANT